jgi:type VI secretion system protein ImpG
MDDRSAALAVFREELDYLRIAGESFARQHPKIAERLELSRDGSSDPHVERLIESFAFLASRIQRRLNSEFPEFTTALLGLLYPNLVDPIPPMTIARIVADPARGKLTTGYTVPRHTELFAQTTNGLACRFRTAYPTTLWPLQIVEAAFVPKARFDFLDANTQTSSVLRLRLESRGTTFSDLELTRLRFHLNGVSHITGVLYELLFGHCTGVVIHDRATNRFVSLPLSSLRPVGFGPDDDVIPYPRQSHPAYRILQEYFWLPEKFLFFDLSGLDRNPSIVDLDILFLFDTTPRQHVPLTIDTFALGCTPVVNLFARTSEPIRLDHTRTEYRIVPDARREPTTEVHSIIAVSSTSNRADESRHLRPFYSTAGSTSPGDAFWYARRILTERVGLSGTDVLLSFVDLGFNPNLPPAETVFAHLLCTNRDLAQQLPENARLQTEEPGPISHIHCLLKPTPSGYPPLGGASRWALISNLSLNSLSLSNDPASLEAFKKILSLYSLSNSTATQRQIDSIEKMTVRKVTRRRGAHPWKSFQQGYEVNLHLSSESPTASVSLLFGKILQEVLSIHAGINSFVTTRISGTNPQSDRK